MKPLHLDLELQLYQAKEDLELQNRVSLPMLVECLVGKVETMVDSNPFRHESLPCPLNLFSSCEEWHSSHLPRLNCQSLGQAIEVGYR